MDSKIQRLQYLSRRIAEMQIEFMEIKNSFYDSNEAVTVYTVKPTKVKAHVRRGFRARRIKR